MVAMATPRQADNPPGGLAEGFWKGPRVEKL